jgi:hypothetical protein
MAIAAVIFKSRRFSPLIGMLIPCGSNGDRETEDEGYDGPRLYDNSEQESISATLKDVSRFACFHMSYEPGLIARVSSRRRVPFKTQLWKAQASLSTDPCYTFPALPAAMGKASDGSDSDAGDRQDEVDDTHTDPASEPVATVDPHTPAELRRLYGWFQKMLDDHMIQGANTDSFIRAACPGLGTWSFPLWLS